MSIQNNTTSVSQEAQSYHLPSIFQPHFCTRRSPPNDQSAKQEHYNDPDNREDFRRILPLIYSILLRQDVIYPHETDVPMYITQLQDPQIKIMRESSFAIDVVGRRVFITQEDLRLEEEFLANTVV